jgi:hypothetical protein
MASQSFKVTANVPKTSITSTGLIEVEITVPKFLLPRDPIAIAFASFEK